MAGGGGVIMFLLNIFECLEGDKVPSSCINSSPPPPLQIPEHGPDATVLL